jgi:hypothetical protein
VLISSVARFAKKSDWARLPPPADCSLHENVEVSRHLLRGDPAALSHRIEIGGPLARRRAFLPAWVASRLAHRQ